MKTKFYKIISILLSVSLLLTVASVSAIAEESVDEVIVNDYYVQSPGYAALEAEGYADSTDKGAGTLENPAHTVADLIGIIGDSLTANDTANVYILQREDWAANNGTRIGDYTAEDGTAVTDNSPRNSITAWCYNGGTITAHDYTLVLRSPEGEQNFLAYSTYIGRSDNLRLGGPTVFENVTFLDTKTNNDCDIDLLGYDASFGESTKYAFIAKIYTSNSDAWTGDVTYRDSWSMQISSARNVGGNNNNTFDGMTINISSPIVPGNTTWITKRRLTLGIGAGSNTFVSGDVTIILDNENMELPIQWGNSASKNWNKPTFQKTLNFNIKSAKSVSHNVINANTYNGVTVTGGLQAIVPEGFEFDPTLIGLGKNNEAGTYRDCVVTNGGRYIIERISDDPEIIDFAKDASGNVIAGTYTIKDGYTATATTDIIEATVDATTGEYTKTVTDTVTNVSKDGLLTVPAGETTVTFEKAPVSTDYYVMSTGYASDGTAGDGRSADKPAATVADVIATIKEDGLVAGDTANVYILQDADGATAFDSTKASTHAHNSTTNILKHNMTAWSDVGNTTTTHDFTLVVKSPEGEQNYLTFSSYMGVNRVMYLGGPTVFENVTITAVRSQQDDRLITNGYDVTFGEDTKFGFIKTSGTSVTSVSLNNNAPEGIAITNTKNATFTDDVNITLNNPYDYAGSTYDRKAGLHLPSSGSVTGVTFKEDVNVTIDNENAKWAISWFGFTTGATATFEKTVNINVKAAAGIYRSLASGDYSAGTATITNGLQIIYPSSATFEDLTSTMTEKGITNYWIINNTSNDGDMISFVTDEETGDTVAGKYAIAEGVVAVAADAEDKVVAVSDDGVLDLSEIPGTYAVRFVEQFDNDGSTITVYEAGEIDLATVSHDEIDGKVFIGWADKDGNYPAQVASYVYGDVLYAQYIDYTTADFGVEMTEMRDDSTGDTVAPSLRYVFSENKGLPNVTYRGVLMLPVTESYGAELYVDEPIVRIWNFDSEAKDNNFTPGTTGATPNSIEMVNILEETEDTLKYTLCLTGMTEAEYDEYYAVRGYIKYQDNNGIDGIFYADQDLTSLYKTVAETDSATMTASEKATADAIIEYVEGDRVAEYWTSHGLTEEGYVTETTETQYVDMGCGCFGTEECTHHLMNIANEKGTFGLRDIFIDTGIEGFEETQIGFITDTHWSYVNKTDIDTNHVALSSYRGRGDFKKHTGYYVDRGMMEFASMFGKTVHTGDMMDYFSNGALTLVERLYSKQSVMNRNIRTIVSAGSSVAAIGNSMSAALGNHDPKSLSSNDIKGLTEPLSVDELHEIIGEKWPNDTRYSSEIMLDSNGNEQILNIYLDNSETGAYTEAQYEHLAVDLAYARAQKEAGNELAIFVYQHRPMLTMNPNETEWKYLTGYFNSRLMVPQDNSYYDISEDGTYTVKSDIEAVAKVAGKVPNVVDMTNHSGWAGSGVDPTAADAYNLIRQNADIITAVFCGHIHTNAESIIMGLTADGVTTDEYTIPQYVGYLAGYGTVQRIIVK